MSNLREFTEELPFEENFVTIIHIPADGEIAFYQTKTEKRNLADEGIGTNDRLIAAWPGRWTTDMFDLPNHKLKEV